jgi:pimeloyl-ACP methyl ester carboxylesterase
MSQRQVWLSLSALALTAGALHAQSASPRHPRRVFALHAGVHIYLSHPWKNHAAEVLRDQLIERKMPARDIVVLENPFPSATWKDMVPRDGLVMFLQAMDPKSQFAQDAYVRMHKTFQAHQVGPDDEIVWIGHSAGGQIGMTMAHLASALNQYPGLAKAARSYRFHSIITLGTPVGSNHVPASVQVRHYYSPQDKVVRIACDGAAWLLPSLGYKRAICPCTAPLEQNCRVRCWYGVDHPDWIWEPRVLTRVLADLEPSCASPWQEPLATPSPGGMLAQLVCRMLEGEQRICLEELP